jgi:GNAT superfamily N-acetyltransferase
MEIVIRHPTAEDQAEWLRMRVALWPDSSAASHAEEIAAFLTGNLTTWLSGLHAVAVFVAVRPGGGLCGFLEGSVRPLAEGCTTHPVGYVEGWFVDPDVRRQGVGKALAKAAEEWAARQGCREMASDAWLANSVSIAAHKALSFNEDLPTVHFRKWLPATLAQEKPVIKSAQDLTLVPLDGPYAVCRLAADAPLPEWVASGSFVSITRSVEELSVVCPQGVVPEGVRCEPGWRCLRVAGTLDLSLTGVLASLLGPLADGGVSAFALSTFDTDYVLVKEKDLLRAGQALRRAGHTVRW